MPLHLIFQCCKCKKYLCHDIWSIARNHKYSDSKYVCQHFNVIIDHESSCGFLGIGWRNKITIEAYCKTYYDTKTVFSKTFNKNYTEHQSYARFNNLDIMKNWNNKEERKEKDNEKWKGEDNMKEI